MLFCPTCANLLLIEKTPQALFRFFCKTCPYVFLVSRPFEKRLGTLTMNVFRSLNRTSITFTKKEVDDVLGGKDTWENVDQTHVDGCAKCGNQRAYFMQIQIRSADEPMTIFYKCVECANQWREN